MEEPGEDDLFQYYLEIGAIEIAGIDPDGELIFKVTEYAEEVAPELWDSHTNYVDKTLIDLFNKDLISVEYDENLQATISLTPEAYKIIEEKGIRPIDE
jgi:hypothetical protein